MSIRFTRKEIKTFVSGETPDKGWRHLLLEMWRQEEKNSMRSFSLAATDAFAFSYICGIRFYPRLLFIVVAIDVNLAPIKAATHVRDSAGWLREQPRKLASFVLLRFKEPIKIPRWPISWLINGAMCSRFDDVAW